MSDQCNSCAASGNCAVDPDQCGTDPQKSLHGSLNRIGKVIVVMSGKGGVGKSSITALLASAFVRHGNKVGILDADITGPSQHKAFGMQNHKLTASQYGLIPPTTATGIKIMSVSFFLPAEDDPVIWRGPMLSGAVKQFWGEVDWRELDYLFIDLPPGTGDVPLTVIQSLPVSGIVIVSSPQDLAFMVVKKTIKMTSKMQIPVLGLVENMSHFVCPHCGDSSNIFGPNRGAQVAADYGINFLGSLPWDSGLNALVDAGLVEEYNSPDTDRVAAAVLGLLKE